MEIMINAELIVIILVALPSLWYLIRNRGYKKGFDDGLKIGKVIAKSHARVLEGKLKQLRAKIEEYEADCSLRLDEDDETCRKCDKAQFSSIYRMIDKILEENKTEKDKE